MDEARKGEIAVKVLVHLLVAKGAHFGPSLMEQLEKFSTKSGIPLDEVNTFCKAIINEAAEKLFTSTPSA